MNERALVMEITPTRLEEQVPHAMENVLAALVDHGEFALEIAGGLDGLRTLVRTPPDSEVLHRALRAANPQSDVFEIAKGADPLRLQPGERAWTLPLNVVGEEYLPLKLPDRERSGGSASDPLRVAMSAMTAVGTGERMVARLTLSALPIDWALVHRERGLTGPGSANQQLADNIRESSMNSSPTGGLSLSTIAPAIALVPLGYLAYTAYEAGEMMQAAAYSVGGVALAVITAVLIAKYKRKQPEPTFHDPLLIRTRLEGIAFNMRLELTAVLPHGESYHRAADLLSSLSAAYQAYNHPVGSRFVPGEIEERILDPDIILPPIPPKKKLFGKAAPSSIIGVKEAAALWRPLDTSYDTPSMKAGMARTLSASGQMTSGQGALVGQTTAGAAMPVTLPEDTLRRHAFLVAKTRMGKSTLMQHVVSYKLQEKAEGRNTDAIVVIDPHSDLVHGLLGQVPEPLIRQTAIIDLGDTERVAGINLLDAHVFEDRELVSDTITQVMRGSWMQWGPRMQGILEHVIKSLHEANRSSRTERDEQYTLLDAYNVLVDQGFRDEMLSRVDDLHLLRWWDSEYYAWDQRLRGDAVAPVLNRLSYYTSSVKARQILGQSRSTLDIRTLVRGGGVLLVAGAQASVGRQTAALVSAGILNLVDSVIRQQGALPPHQRRSAFVAVDEMQTITGVDYEGMLGELAKYGGTLMIATQSLKRLDDISPTMRDSIMANNGCLVSFQVAGEDARRLVWEFGRERVTEEDLTSLPVHHCYVRAIADGQRLPAFSMHLDPPMAGDMEVAREILNHRHIYTVPIADVDRKLRMDVEESLGTFRRKLDTVSSLRMGNGNLPVDVNRADADSPEAAPVAGNGRRKANSRKPRKRRGRPKAGQEGMVKQEYSNR